MSVAERPRTPWLTADRLALAGLLVLTLLVRGSVLWAMRANLQQDPDAYREIAENLLRHGEFALGKGDPEGGAKPFHPTAYRPPLYPVILSNLPSADGRQVSLAKVAALHLLLGAATVWLTWLTARRYFANHIGPEGRQEIAPTVRSGTDEKTISSPRSEGPARVSSEASDGPSGLVTEMTDDSTTPASRPGLLHFGPPGLRRAPLMAGFLIACDPILLNQQTLIMTETLAAFLAILSLWCLARFDAARSWFNAALAGGAIGLAVLCRPTFLPWLAIVALTVLLVRGRNAEFRIQNSERHWLDNFGWRLANVAGLVIAAGAVMSPWVIRNYRVFGKPIITTTHGGYTFYLANNAEFYDYLNHHQSGPWIPTAYFGQLFPSYSDSLSAQQLELLNDGDLYKVAGLDISRNLSTFIKACVYRLRQLWSPLPHKLTADESSSRRLLRYATCAWYCGVYLLAAIGIWRLRWKLLAPPWIWGLLLCLAFTAVHTFYWTNLRMRAPLMPFVALVAAAAHISPKRERG